MSTNSYSWENKYKKKDNLGEGGNAVVYLVQDESGSEFALKVLKPNVGKVKSCRISEEIRILLKIKGQTGIIPIFDYGADSSWYTMPVAIPIMKKLDSFSNADEWFSEVQTAIMQLSEVLESLHHSKIAHRDIKPTNLYYYNEHYCFGDFGLVDFPNHLENLTNTHTNLGAKFTIAPEMKRSPKDSDSFKADIYSLAKTFWMILTKNKLGFEGVYNYLDESIALRYIESLRGKHIAELEQLIHDSTSNAPENRPSIDEFRKRVNNWVRISNDINLSQESDWRFLEKLIFGRCTPRSAVWDDFEDIKYILQVITSSPAYNHMLFSDSGGLDLKGVHNATEEGWLDMIVEPYSIYRIKPKYLYFEYFQNHIEWNYFRIELFNEPFVLEPPSNGSSYEVLVEDYPAHYVSSVDYCYGVYDYDSEKPLPESSKLIRRYLGGIFLLVMKFGLYNGINSTYDGRHGDCSNKDLRKYIETLITIADMSLEKGLEPLSVLNSSYISRNPFIDNAEETTTISANQSKAERDIRIALHNHITKMKFPIGDVSFANPNNHRSVYYLSYNYNSFESLLHFRKDNQRFLASDGYIKKLSEDSFKECLLVGSLNEAFNLKSSLENYIKEHLNESDLKNVQDSNKFFSIKMIRSKLPPHHLFSKNEIKDEMRKADDRLGNVLVIDDDGYVHIVSPSSSDVTLYPTRGETWDARNNFVGKYSSLSCLDEAYLNALVGWLRYLETGKPVYSDYTNLTDDKEIIDKILNYY